MFLMRANVCIYRHTDTHTQTQTQTHTHTDTHTHTHTHLELLYALWVWRVSGEIARRLVLAMLQSLHALKDGRGCRGIKAALTGSSLVSVCSVRRKRERKRERV